MASSIIGQLRVILGLDTAAYEKGLDDIQRQNVRAARQMEKFGQRMSDVGRNMSIGLTLPLLAVGGAALGMAAKFEAGMNRVEAATGAAGRQLDMLRQKAVAIGKDKGFTATAADAADIMEMLAKNGATTDQILGGLTESTAKLSAATGGDFAQSADIVTDILQQFNRQASETGGIVDKVTGAMLVSKMGFDDYRLAIGQTGGVAGGLGLSFEDMNVALAATSSLFASGSDAGTSFKTFLTSLPGKSKEAKGAIEAYGLSFYDAQGNMKSMGDIAQTLQDRLGGLNDQAQSEVLTTIFGTDAMRTAIGLMNQGADGIARIRGEVDKASAQTQMEARMKGWSGAMTQVKKAFEAAAISFGDSGILTALTKVALAFAGVITAASNLPQPLQIAIGGVLGLTAVVGPLVFITGKAIAMWAGMAVLLAGRLAPSLLGTAAATTATGVAATGAAARFVFLRASMAFMLGPYGAAIGAISLALYGLGKVITPVSDETHRYNQRIIELRKQAAATAASTAGYTNALASSKDMMAANVKQAYALVRALHGVAAAQAQADVAKAKSVVLEKWAGLNQANASDQRSPFAKRRGVPQGGTAADRAVRKKATDEYLEADRAYKAAEQDFAGVGKKVRAEFDRILSGASATPPPAAVTPANDDEKGGGKGGGKSGPTKEELANRREELRLSAEIEAAQIRGDSATVQRLQDQADIKRQIADYEDAGLTKLEAKKAAEGDLAAIAAARRIAAQREIAVQRASVELDAARLSGDDALIIKLEREQEIKDRILFFERQLVDITDQKLRLEQATVLALEQQASIDAARAAGRARWMADDEARRQIDLMKARGDSDEAIRQAQRRYDIERRIEELKRNGLEEGAAREKAETEDREMEAARQQGQWRDTFKGAIRAAMDGDLGGFVKNWWKEQMAKGMENALNSISDLLFNLIGSAFQQGAGSIGGGGGGGLFGTILGGIGSIFGDVGGGIGGGLPGAGNPIINQNAINRAFPSFAFAKGTGGWMEVGGRPGIDRNPVNMALSKGEKFRVLKKGEDMGGGRNSITMHNDFRGADAGAVAGISAKLDQLDRSLEGRALGAYVDAKQRRLVRG